MEQSVTQPHAQPGGYMPPQPPQPPQPPAKKRKKWPWVLGGAAVLLVIVAVAGGNSEPAPQPGPAPAPAPAVAPGPPPAAPEPEANSGEISLAEFNQLQPGMTYDEVVAIVGGPGQVLSESEMAGYRTVIYQWNGDGFAGGNANATFQNDELINKAQFGLR